MQCHRKRHNLGVPDINAMKSNSQLVRIHVPFSQVSYNTFSMKILYNTHYDTHNTQNSKLGLCRERKL